MTKRALLVGINRYATPGCDLRGCVNDALNMRKLLITNGYQAENITLLTDAEATGKRVMSTLAQLIRSAAAGDRLAYWHSSHGTRVQDRNGDEASGQDSVLCCHDFDWSDPSTYILDDWMAATLLGLDPDATITIGADACHSGTANRDVRCRARYLPPPFRTAARVRPLFASLLPHPQDNHDDGTEPTRLPDQRGLIFISGCRDDQTSADSDFGAGAPGGQYQGAMTASILRAADRKLLGKVRLAWEYALSWLDSAGYQQIPQLAADPRLIDGPMF